MNRYAKALRRHRTLALVALSALVLSACASSPLDTTKPVGEHAKSIDFLYRFSGIMAIVVGLFVGAAVLVVIIKFRARPGTEDELPEQVEGHLKAEISWTLIPVGMLVVLTAFTLPKVFELNETSDGMTVRVEGQQWWWQFMYDIDEDGEYDIVTANEIVIPVGEEVNLEITSNDVIHSFWVPRLNGKRDAVPGRVHPWLISSPVPGVFWGECTEFCGLSHANMQIRAVVLEQADFDRWVAEQLSGADREAPAIGSAAQAGMDLFAQHCSTCHIVEGTFEAPNTALLRSGVAPNLTNLMTRTSFAGALFDLYLDNGDLNVAELREWVRDAPGRKPLRPDNQQGMVSFKDILSEDDLDNIIAYLQTLGHEPILPE
jgi:cytochrome c oxidase subunit 2